MTVDASHRTYSGSARSHRDVVGRGDIGQDVGEADAVVHSAPLRPSKALHALGADGGPVRLPEPDPGLTAHESAAAIVEAVRALGPQQAEVAALRDGFGPGGALQLPVDRGDLALHRVAGDV